MREEANAIAVAPRRWFLLQLAALPSAAAAAATVRRSLLPSPHARSPAAASLPNAGVRGNDGRSGDTAGCAMAETAELGAVVWARVAGQGSWPAQVFDESLVSSRVKRSKRAGTVLLAFFGDSTSGWCAPPARPPLALSSDRRRL